MLTKPANRTLVVAATVLAGIGLAQLSTLVTTPWSTDVERQLLDEGATVDYGGEPWEVRYDGYGAVSLLTAGDCPVFDLQPAAASSSDRTHAALVRSVGSAASVDLDVEMRTVEQLREGGANTWESAWLLWHVTADQSFYYFTLKTNGWELGKADPEYPGAQRFLASGDAPAVGLGDWDRVQVVQTGTTMTISVDGDEITTFTDDERPLTDGGVGFYTEDAKVQFRSSTCASGT